MQRGGSFRQRGRGAPRGGGRGGSRGRSTGFPYAHSLNGERRNSFSGGYRPQVAEHSVTPRAPRQDADRRDHSRRSTERDVVVILEKAGLLLGNLGLVDAYERAATTELANPSVQDVRPDIVHQCLLALYDSDLAYQNRLRVYVCLFARNRKVIEISPALRPPRTYARFRGLVSVLLRDGRVTSTDGQVLMRVLPGSIAPIIPDGAEVIGLTNALQSPVETAVRLARQAHAHPIPDSLQGGVKNVEAFYCISCTDDCSLDGIDYITRSVCLSAYPMTSHVMAARVCEAHALASAEDKSSPS